MFDLGIKRWNGLLFLRVRARLVFQYHRPWLVHQKSWFCRYPWLMKSNFVRGRIQGGYRTYKCLRWGSLRFQVVLVNSQRLIYPEWNLSRIRENATDREKGILTFIKIWICQFSTDFFDDLDMLKVYWALVIYWVKDQTLRRVKSTFSRKTASTARFAKYSLSWERTFDDRVVRAMLNKSSRNFRGFDLSLLFSIAESSLWSA